MAKENEQIYPVPKALYEGLMAYLKTRPLGEALDGYMALLQIQPVEMVTQGEDEATAAPKRRRRTATDEPGEGKPDE